MSWRLLASEGVGAAEGLAFDEAMMLPYATGMKPRSGATLRLYRYRPHCALVGRYQSLEDEVDLEACRRLGVQTGRRPTGGGAILMGPDQLGVALASPTFPGLTSREVLRRWAQGVQAGLERLGIEAKFRSKNDLEVQGRKIAGLGLYRDEAGALLFHSSVLLDLDVALMLEVLKIPGAKLSDKGISRVEERVTTVSRELGRRLVEGEVREAFVAGFAETFDVEMDQSELDGAERSRCSELIRARYGDPSWVNQRRPRGNALGTAVLKTREGLLRVHVAVQGTVIQSALVSGDWNAPVAGMQSLEAALKWSRADEEQIGEQVAAHLDEGSLGAPLEKLTAALWKATRQALELQRMGHPVRREGACYAPGLEDEEAGSATERPGEIEG